MHSIGEIPFPETSSPCKRVRLDAIEQEQSGGHLRWSSKTLTGGLYIRSAKELRRDIKTAMSQPIHIPRGRLR